MQPTFQFGKCYLSETESDEGDLGQVRHLTFTHLSGTRVTIRRLGQGVCPPVVNRLSVQRIVFTDRVFAKLGRPGFTWFMQPGAAPMKMQMPPAIDLYVEGFNAGDFETVLAQFTPDAVIHGVLGSFPVQQAEPIWRELHQSMAIELIPQAVVLDSAGAAVRYIERGCFRAPFRGLAGHEPTHRSYEITAIEWFEMYGSKIHKRWGARDSASITKQVLE